MSASTPVIVIRPQPGCDATVAAARALGLDAHAVPLFEIAPQPWQAPPPDEYDALLFGSGNALRHAGPALARYAGLPVYAVGAETAQAVVNAGFDIAATGSGGLQQVLGSLAPGHNRLLRLTGAAHVPLEPPPGVAIADRVIYASTPRPLPPRCVTILRGGALVLLHSAEAAKHFAQECARLEIARAAIILATLAPRIAAAAGDGWRTVRFAEEPTNPALLALAAELCQVVPGLRGTV